MTTDTTQAENTPINERQQQINPTGCIAGVVIFAFILVVWFILSYMNIV